MGDLLNVVHHRIQHPSNVNLLLAAQRKTTWKIFSEAACAVGLVYKVMRMLKLGLPTPNPSQEGNTLPRR